MNFLTLALLRATLADSRSYWLYFGSSTPRYGDSELYEAITDRDWEARTEA